MALRQIHPPKRHTAIMLTDEITARKYPLRLGAVSRDETGHVPATHSKAADGERVWPPAEPD